MQTYDIRINEYQRKLLDRAIHALMDLHGEALCKEDGDRSEPGLCGGEETAYDEAAVLLALVAELPSTHEAGVTSSFCD